MPVPSVVTGPHDPLHCTHMPAPPPPAPPLCTSADELTRATALLVDADLLALDTEFMRTNTYAPLLCLVQIASRQQLFCVDELAEFDSQLLWQAIVNRRPLCVLHAAKQDLEVIRLSHGLMLPTLFDTQIAAGLAGHAPQIGYGKLVSSMLGIELDKAHTRADWSRRPLNEGLLRYAAEDVLYLPELYDRLKAQLEEQGRLDWAIEDSLALLDPALYETRPEDAWQRLSGLSLLPAAAQQRARRLAAWRESRAISSNRPRQWILSDRTILDIARSAPADSTALAACEEMPPAVVRRHSEALLAEIALAAEDDLAAAQGSLIVQQEALDQGEYRRLAKLVAEIAAGLGIAPEILATRRDISALMRGERSLRILRGWRQAIVGEPLLAALPAA